MKSRYSKTVLAAAMTTLLISCGGGNQDAGEAVEEGAADVAEATSDAVDEAGAALEEAGDDVAAATDEAIDDAGAAMDEAGDEVAATTDEATDEAGAMADEAGDEVAAATDDAAEGADEMAAGAEGGWTDLQANWQDSVESIQAKWGELSEEDLMSTGGDREQFVALIQDKYNLGEDEAEQQVSEWEATL